MEPGRIVEAFQDWCEAGQKTIKGI